jgi:hypothetical protein
MSGKEFVAEAIESIDGVISKMVSAGALADDPLREGTVKARKELGLLAGKATLRTKKGTSIAFPVLEAAKNMEEAWGNGDMEDLRERLDEFITSVETLDAALQGRQLIMT